MALALALLAVGCSDGADDAQTDAGGRGSVGSSGTTSGGTTSGGSKGDSGSGGSAPVTSSFPDAQIFVDAHNAVRAAVQAPANYSGTWTAVPPVDWSDEVAQTAQEWANHLKDTKDCGLEHAMGSGYGENLAAGTNIDAARAVEMWESEIDDYTYSPKYTFETNTGHYTQIVWRSTKRIGCASATCSRSTVVVCRYDPPGNYIGQQVY